MRSLFSFVFILAALLVLQPVSAQAEVFLWKGSESKASVTVPDTWRQVHAQKSDEVFHFTAPGNNEFAACRLRVRDDRRFVIFPRHYADEVQRLNYSFGFWEDYLGDFDDFQIHNVQDNAGLGRGFASMAEASYVTPTSPKIRKRGIMFATVYNDKAYIFDCSAEATVYHKWHDAFLSVAHSVDFRKSIYGIPGGDYRDFFRDGYVIIEGVREVDRAVY